MNRIFELNQKISFIEFNKNGEICLKIILKLFKTHLIPVKFQVLFLVCWAKVYVYNTNYCPLIRVKKKIIKDLSLIIYNAVANLFIHHYHLEKRKKQMV
ncbi:hypothetical protein BpHYR1_040485 [Brachionus plicatilis]|uniref:Uncharacterized protein n=1 Tax=Brachionus plicatilis TaxID=10195 RepID=A0A3M7T2S3_BRAPC|nr:hypothetical protein BpHYR1_040485 [Brachionus plicatilis]